ncbi:MAG: protein kinase, partial [Verrucomicrobiaceae bacterium]|nr:protein kinase [Verrucomicrobiaceae bacterium]
MPDDHFHPEKLLAGGPAAKVYRGVETATGRKVLLKALLHEDETPNALDRERLQLLAPVLMQFRHPQIAGLITMLPTEDEFALIYDFMPGMNVRAFANERQTSPADLRALAVQLMHALLVGEQLRQPHGDPKPSNLIIADHPSGGLFMQVQDWGLSLARSIHPTETLWFRAPELHASNTP